METNEFEKGKEMISTIDISDFKSIADKMEYLDDSVLVSQTLETPVYHKKEVERVSTTGIIRLKFFLIVSCSQGNLQMEINGTPYRLDENSVLFILPTMVVSGVKASPDCQVRFLGFSTTFLNNVIKKEKSSERALYNIYRNPVWHVEHGKDSPVINGLGLVIMEKIKEKDNRYRKDILRYLFSAIFCDMMNELQNRIGEVTAAEQDRSYKRANYVFKNFLSELTKDGGMHRSVNYFADQLCYSPKYVSSIVKQISGRTALDWINEYAMEQIKVQLKHSDMSIKEVADYFNFSNQSFFGKYVKAHLGVSPARYRSMNEE